MIFPWQWWINSVVIAYIPNNDLSRYITSMRRGATSSRIFKVFSCLRNESMIVPIGFRYISRHDYSACFRAIQSSSEGALLESFMHMQEMLSKHAWICRIIDKNHQVTSFCAFKYLSTIWKRWRMDISLHAYFICKYMGWDECWLHCYSWLSAPLKELSHHKIRTSCDHFDFHLWSISLHV